MPCLDVVRAKRKRRRSKGGPIKITHPGSLKSLGYDPDYPASKRRKALVKAVRKYGYATVIR